MDSSAIHQKELFNVHSKKELEKNLPIILIGAGSLCSKFLNNEIELSKRVIKIFDSDTSKKGSYLNNIEIKHISEINKLDTARYTFIITSSFIKQIKKALKSYAIYKAYSYYYILCDRWINKNQYKLSKDKVDRILLVLNYLYDEKSKEVLNELLQLRDRENLDYSDICTKEEYFPDFIKFHSNEIFIDGGAYDGKDSLKFIKKLKSKYNKIYLFELSPSNFKLINNQDLSIENVSIHNLGLWNTESYLDIQGSGQSARVNIKNYPNPGFKEPNLITLDTFFENKDKPTFIKLDIEGAELEALEGAQNIIVNHKPKLAICIYHKPDDLYLIPEYIKKLVPEYKFYIRHHSNTLFGTVLYAAY